MKRIYPCNELISRAPIVRMERDWWWTTTDGVWDSRAIGGILLGMAGKIDSWARGT